MRCQRGQEGLKNSSIDINWCTSKGQKKFGILTSKARMRGRQKGTRTNLSQKEEKTEFRSRGFLQRTMGGRRAKTTVLLRTRPQRGKKTKGKKVKRLFRIRNARAVSIQKGAWGKSNQSSE